MSTMRAARPVPNLVAIDYPESDGQPMAETDVHRNEMVDLIAMLEARYAGRDDVYVSGNLLLYHQEGDPRAAVAPDVFVVFGVPKGPRRVYKLWAEGRPPTVVIEVTSRKTRSQDLRQKRALYARLGVREYLLYDPEAEYLRPALQAFHLVDGDYLPNLADPSGALRSPSLELDLRLTDGRLELHDTASGQRLLRPAEWARALAAERGRATKAETEATRLRAELARLRGGGPGSSG